MERDKNFEALGFPVDIHWMDIPYTDSYQYFKFDKMKFPLTEVNIMNAQIENHFRRIVVICDPHIK